jgi:hypothetical protein
MDETSQNCEKRGGDDVSFFQTRKVSPLTNLIFSFLTCGFLG